MPVQQLPLFDLGVAPAVPAPGVAELAARLPSEVRLGTSSWSFPGWAGLVFDRAHPLERLAREGLAAYARHPLLCAVGIDRGYYAPLPEPVYAGYAAQVDERFRFLAKAHEGCTLARFPRGPRGGARAGEANPRFLDPAYARDAVVAPFARGLGARAGALVFQFPPQDPREAGSPEAFAERLHRFLADLPRGPLYAVEIRTPGWLTEAYARALADAGAVHVLSVHPSMPELDLQARLAAPALERALVVRWMLRRDRSYEGARARYQPFDRLVDPDSATREAVARLAARAAAGGRPAYVVANNKAEGSAPLTLARLAERIAALARFVGGAPKP